MCSCVLRSEQLVVATCVKGTTVPNVSVLAPRVSARGVAHVHKACHVIDGLRQ